MYQTTGRIASFPKMAASDASRNLVKAKLSDDEDDSGCQTTYPLGCEDPQRDGSDSSSAEELTLTEKAVSPTNDGHRDSECRQTGAIPKVHVGGDHGRTGRVPIAQWSSSPRENSQDQRRPPEAGDNEANVGRGGDEGPTVPPIIRPTPHSSSGSAAAFERYVTDDGITSQPEEDCQISLPDLKTDNWQRLPPTVRSGDEDDMITFAGQLVSKQFSLERGQEGLLSTKSGFVPKNGQFGVKCIKQNVGEGAHSKVHVIQDTTSGAMAALKCVEWGHFVSSESDIWVGLNHRNINSLFGLICDDNSIMFASEYDCNYETLQLRVDRRPIGQGEAVVIIQQLFAALVYLHEKKIIHRDVYPSNVLVKSLPSNSDLPEYIKLIDFGTSVKLSGRTHTTSDYSPEGNAAYRAPEIERGEPYDGRVDVWSAICTLMFQLKGHALWIGKRYGDYPNVDIPRSTNGELRTFIEWAHKVSLNQRPTSKEVFDACPMSIVKQLYSIPATVSEPPAADYKSNKYAVSETRQPPDDSLNNVDSQTSEDGLSTDEAGALTHDETEKRDTCTIPHGVKGIFVTVHYGDCEPVKIKLSPSSNTAADVAEALCKQIPTPFTLSLKNGSALDRHHTFGPGNYDLDAVTALDGRNWVWCIDERGKVTSV
ncbi:MAP3K epsilon protein kinase 1-like [Acanthaster planci]|uniref:MAP3K epsilon protein kinase 1-like n=1 Tax=Acanthaster planci TaxID=133434 RepID=A0A8B7XSD0_ACAPL|nr:MAP3K epsilon protein kinase 1-like [Acanthaster planci]